MNVPDYVEVQAVLAEDGEGEQAAEAHGTLCGLLCAGSGDLPGAWVANTLADGTEGTVQAGDGRGVLEVLYKPTVETMAGEEMSFQLLLPDDDRPLPERAQALAAWCQGFLYGLAVRGLKSMEELPDELREVLTDLS